MAGLVVVVRRRAKTGPALNYAEPLWRRAVGDLRGAGQKDGPHLADSPRRHSRRSPLSPDAHCARCRYRVGPRHHRGIVDEPRSSPWT